MELDVIDSVTGELLGSAIRAGKGNQFELDTFSKLDDVKDVIDQWAKTGIEKLNSLKKNKK